MVLVYLLGLTGYITYILHTSSTDKLQAAHLFVASLGSMFLALITAFLDLEKTRKAELNEELTNEDLNDNV
jgi:Na+/melibiose symporter-like transporter